MPTTTTRTIVGAVAIAVLVLAACGAESSIPGAGSAGTGVTTPGTSPAVPSIDTMPATGADAGASPTTLPDWATTPGPTWPEPGFVALTFDDGPDPTYTEPMLELLAELGVPATFFVVGRSAASWPELVQAMVDGGHAVGNHSWDHPNLTTLSDQAVADQLQRTNDAVFAAIGVAPRCLRPPQGATDERVEAIADQLGLHTVLWNVNPDDYLNPPPDELVRRVIDASVERPSRTIVVGLHDGGGDRTNTLQALPGIVEGLRDAGFDFTRLC